MKSIMRRIAKLEAHASTAPGWQSAAERQRRKWQAACGPIHVRLGHLRRLPEDYEGERHIVVTERLPDQDGWEWVEYAEVPGPSPISPPPDPRLPRYNHVVFVAPIDSVPGPQARSELERSRLRSS